ncbi:MULTISPECIES: hypothetical protein [Burkholderia]|uniref:hypothetical protein n=1 Tax=Burkholderia TaxID=32008 RepID=UPI0007554036|nr:MULTISPECIES: hypothetical protein [Burkholderia]AOJ72264.1 hypothetical protein WS78_26415 [Burkholderia savannae]KVG44247.1 hypothetical protein WS77_09965 [Burkholderia sp. MSMB0265]KVG87775.1 hypothetical protein WS81_25950 [Burkholderia sp. MSMB2040]KVG96382.1 hypothetical protein WS83_03205 [Burkholderia sp. MSMB2042]KVG97176.1 hypothetical protein WS82_30175 [Burkholderia sp. MSMB2041]
MSKHESTLKLHYGLMPRTATADEIKREPMFFRADVEYASKHGGDLTRNFIDAAYEVWGDLSGVIIDTRHHMLMPGMFPCIPGWHTDDAPRSNPQYAGQPDLFDPEYVTEHLLTIVDNGTGSLTEFLQGDVALNPRVLIDRFNNDGDNFYKTADQIIDLTRPGWVIHPRAGDVVAFNSHSWHRGTPAQQRGFRWFARMTRGSRHAVQNELRSNSQVYLTDATYGW